ncbi:hypothetical protein N473_07060 [Pseudoalteromonas luteoviolacea CPMOR-1]|uniref:HTH marR-type domain-containing protein n=1 Tax=Pseudoalteromonas luteoviolacea CPMOR-1 TaxID=1365248 RepID=A0A167H4M2_9GAMM|nr:MarR family transcriptional regulator [Pseudoalteromonas luteoviolacea]KZN57628.1 hypothetical protein N473_07060 [Pseudoalteromonas luteoviolacea CPMOR-1]
MSNYSSPQIQRTLVAIELMAGHEVYGIEPKALAEQLGCKGPEVTRLLANLREAGWAEPLRNDNQRWRLNKKPVTICNKVAHSFTTAIRDLQIEHTEYSGVTV